MTTHQALKTARDYFQYVLTPNYDAFFDHPSTFATAFNLASSLYHFHEWLFHDFKAELATKYKTPLKSKGAFWQVVQTLDAHFGYVRDVANSSKHVTIGGGGFSAPSTGMTHVANTHIITSGLGERGYGEGRYGGGPDVIIDDGGSSISFDECAVALFIFWEELLNSLP